LQFRAISYIWKATTAKRIETDPVCQRQNCSPLNVLFIDVYISLILLGIPPTITLHRVARVCQRLLGFLVSKSVATRRPCTTLRALSVTTRRRDVGGVWIYIPL